jgi:predicted Fe-Mo cluster-binding NifX family protein
MKVVVSSTGTDLTSQVDPRFGRCSYFLIVDTDSMAYEAIPNSALGAAHGAGIQATQLVVSTGVKTVLTGQVGPNAFHALSASRVQVLTGVSGTVGEVVERFKKGEFEATRRPTVGGHFGTGGRGGGSGAGRGRGGRRPT